MIKIYQSKNNKKLYPHLTRYISDFLNRHKQELPKFLKVKIYDNINCNNTNIGHYLNEKTGRAYNWELEINLKQILNLYTGRQLISIVDRDKPSKVKGFRNYLLFVLYHEIGHYQLRHYKSGYDYNKRQQEIDSDNYAYNRLLQGQLNFNF